MHSILGKAYKDGYNRSEEILKCIMAQLAGCLECLISAYQSLAIIMNTTGFKKLSIDYGNVSLVFSVARKK